MHSRALKISFVALALSGVLLAGCKRPVKGNTPITGQIPTTTTTMAASTSSTMASNGSMAGSSTTSSTMMAGSTSTTAAK